MDPNGGVGGTPKILQGVEAQDRLEEIGIPIRLITAAVLEADDEANRYTSLDPPIMKGIARWARTVQRLRRDLHPQGWTISNPRNLPLTMAPDGSLSVIVTTGSGETGNPASNPTTKYRKGPETARVVGRTETQLPDPLWSLADLGVEEAITEEVVAPEHQTYFLLYAMNEAENSIYAELSQAAKVEPHGEVNNWLERIIVGRISLPQREIDAVD